MTTPHSSSGSRLDSLERQVAALRGQLEALTRGPALQFPQNVRLAMTYSSAPETYPAAPANTFKIRFVDATLDSWAEGDRTPTFTDRSASEQTVAHVLNGSYVGRNTLVRVLNLQRKWWIIDSFGGGSTRIYGALEAALLPSTTSFTTSSYGILSQGAQSISGEVEVFNPLKKQADDTKGWRAEWNEGTARLEIYAVENQIPAWPTEGTEILGLVDGVWTFLETAVCSGS